MRDGPTQKQSSSLPLRKHKVPIIGTVQMSNGITVVWVPGAVSRLHVLLRPPYARPS